MKKSLVLVMVMMLAGSFVFAGGGRNTKGDSTAAAGTADSPGWKANASTPVTLDWYVNFSWFSREWGQSLVSKYVTKNTGVDVRFIVPAGNEAERLNAMIAGNTLPDLITLGWWEGQIGMMVDAGLLEPLNKLAEQYDPYFFKVAKPQILGWYTRSDGNVYGYPNASTTPADYDKYKGLLTSNQTFLVRKDMYEALGKPDMTTPEGFLGALRLAKQRFPTVNGQPLIPLTFQEFTDTGNASFQSYLINHLAQPHEQNGKYEDPNLGPNNPELVRWLKVFRQAAQEGLISMDVFVDKRAQIEEKVAQGRYFAMMYQVSDMQAPQHALYAKDPNTIYISVDGLRNARKDPPKLSGGAGISGWTLTLISKNCKDKARAIQFLTYWLSEEGQRALWYGVPNETYTMVNNVPTLKPEMQSLNTTDKNKQEIEYGFDATYWMLMDNMWRQQYPSELAPSMEQAQNWTREYVTSYAQYDSLDMTPGTDEHLIYDEVQRRWGRDLPRLILAKTEAEFDSIWNDFQKFKSDRGFAKVQAQQTELMKANKVKLGIK
ncbi:ABC transporter substrate-binding protein [Spirochaetia bacterium]|nr:ABC transporter substrate-binding protein [Spirochaetia bacterium]